MRGITGGTVEPPKPIFYGQTVHAVDHALFTSPWYYWTITDRAAWCFVIFDDEVAFFEMMVYFFVIIIRILPLPILNYF